VSIHIIATQTESYNKTFHGWENVPQQYKTRGAWKRAYRNVTKGEKPQAVVIVEDTRRLTCVEEPVEYTIQKTYRLYHASQTQQVSKTVLSIARQDFWQHFGRHANRNMLIRWTKGEWKEDDDGDEYWDNTAEVWDWKTFQGYFSYDKCLDHMVGKEVYGVFGAETSSYLLIDLDLHKQPLDLFLRRLRILLDAFHGKDRPGNNFVDLDQ
jgi:hypothetical protein